MERETEDLFQKVLIEFLKFLHAERRKRERKEFERQMRNIRENRKY